MTNSLIKYSTTAGSNNSAPPDGAPEGQAANTVNNCMRDMMAQIRLLSDCTTGAFADIASATTTNIGAANNHCLRVTGTTTITAFDTVTDPAIRILRFAGILTLTHSGTALILPGAANITTAAGDTAMFVSLGSGNWACIFYQPTSNVASTYITAASTATLTNKTYDTAGTGNTFKINGTTINAISGNTSKVATTTGSLTNGHVITADGSGNLQDGGGGVLLAANNLSDVSAVATALTNLGIAKTAQNNGSTTIGTNGIIIKFGNGTTTTGVQAVSFSSAFPNNIYSVNVTFQFAGFSQLSASVTSVSTSGFTAQVSNAVGSSSGGTQVYYWMAIGN